MELSSPPSLPLQYVTPSSFEVLRRCPLSMAFSQHVAMAGTGNPASWLGDVCHRVLERFVSEGALWRGAWEEELISAWQEELAAEVERVREAMPRGRYGDAQRWPGYNLKQARLRMVARRLRDVLLKIATSAEVLTEVDLVARAGRLRGRADLVIRSKDQHAVIDYKSGSVTQGGNIVPAYERQLQLYSAMEAESSGSWPHTAQVLPLSGPPLEVDVDPDRCDALADSAVALLETFNATVPAVPKAIVAEDSCPACRFAAVCPAFWEGWSANEAEALLAAEGLVIDSRETPLNGFLIRLDAQRGSVGERRIRVRGIDQDLHPEVQSIETGRTVAFAGLVEEPEREASFRLGTRGRLAIRMVR